MRVPAISVAVLTALGLAAGTAHAGHPANLSTALSVAAHHGGVDLDSIHEVRGHGHHGGHHGYHRGHPGKYHHGPHYRHYGPPSYYRGYHGYYGIPSYRYHYYRYGYPHSGFHYRGPRVSFGVHF